MHARHTWLLIVAIAGTHDYLKPKQQLTDEARTIVAQFPILGRVALYSMAAHLAGDMPRRLDWVSGLGWLASRVRVSL